MISPDCPSTTIHSTATAYTDYGCRCPAARAVMAAYERERQAERRAGVSTRQVDPTGSMRRLRALHAIGWRGIDLGARLGVERGVETAWTRGKAAWMQRRVAERITALYLDLCDRPGPSSSAVVRAEAKGWASPPRWLGKNMDDPKALPWPVGDEPDFAAIERIASGLMPWRERSQIERRLAVEILYGRGLTINSIGMVLEDTRDPDANAERMVSRDLAWLRATGRIVRREHGGGWARAS